MKKIVFSGASGNGISPLEQIMVLKGYSVYGTDYSFDIGKDAKRKQALADAGIKIVPQDGSAITDDVEFLCVSAAIKDSNPDVKKAKEKNIPIKFRSDLLKDIFSQYGVDSYIGKCASVIMGSSDTIFYVSSIYFASTSVKKTLLTIPIALLCNVACCVLACFCCRFI